MSNETATRVVDCLAEVTRYPRQLLALEADLENDLGIDSVKRVEIVLALGEAFGLELHTEERDPSIRTIGDVVAWIERLQEQAGVIADEASPFELHEPASEPSIAPSRDTNGHPHTRFDLPHQAKATDSPRQPLEAKTPLSDLPFHGQVALVTGSGRGIGRTTARLLAARGATVIVNSFHSRELGEETAALIAAEGGSAVHLWGSVANPEHVERIFAEIESRFDRLDILVCNASDGKIGSFSDLSFDDWDRAFRTNVSGHYLCAMRAAGLMRKNGGGSIVTMSAVGAHQYINGLGCQGVVKAAVESLTRYLACELGRDGIRVNCVVGGPVYGDLLEKFSEAEARHEHWESMIPDGELTSPLDLAETIAFLVSQHARGVNGAVWAVDHGFSANADGQPLNHAFRHTDLIPTA